LKKLWANIWVGSFIIMLDETVQAAAEPEVSTNLPIPRKRLHLGAAYYPEHWPEEHWTQDIALMQQVGLTVVRMGEFAWSSFEPVSGDLRFDWMDRAITMLAEAGIQTVMGTPTASPPAWLVTAYPDILAVDEHGRKVQFGNRCHYCVNAPPFHDAVQNLVTTLGEHFGSNPHIIGWQLDNEYNRVCYCALCQKRFQQFLAQRYTSLEELNQRWSTAYWSQTYSTWEQIPIPIGGHNPGLMLEFKRFVTDSYRRFQNLQLKALRPHLQPGVWVTHNFMGWYDGFDHYALSEDLDMVSWDDYVGSGHHDRLRHAAVHDLTRGFKRQNYWVMETQPGSVNWSTVNNVLNRGEARAMAWQGIGHGADGILYWQWRSALGGQEQYHGSLVDQSGQPRPFFNEVQKLGRDFQAAGEVLAESQPFPAKVAILNDYDSRWSIQWQKHHQDFDYVQNLLSYYRPLAAQNIPVDIISAHAPLDGYKIVILPSLLIVDEELAKRLDEFVHKGGYLAITPRTGMKNQDNALLPVRQPGPLRALAGAEVEEYYALQEPVEVKANYFQGKTKLWAERLKITTSAQVSTVARYGASNGWLDDQIAITVRGYGYGLVYTLGACLDEEAMPLFFERMLKMANIVPVLRTPPDLEACKRIGPKGEEIFILINHEFHVRQIELPWEADEHITGQRLQGKVRLTPYGVAVLTKAPPKTEPEPAPDADSAAPLSPKPAEEETPTGPENPTPGHQPGQPENSA
jgi:beta-galactosidase